ncbi:MAG: CDP-diacylglycerol--serine O-phosphatidyltransferase [Rikenellaceae bacterium]
MIKSIPNLITLANLFCGMLAVISAVNLDFEAAFIYVILSAVFDFFDGFMARLLKAYSEIGKQLDSLADLVSFGVAPAMVVYFMGLEYTGLLIALASAYRLAKFNIDERQTTTFIGVPTPANALLFMSIGYICQVEPYGVVANFLSGNITLSFLTLVFSYLMISEIPFFSLKFKSYDFKENWIVYSFLLLSLVALILFAITALPFIIMGYVAVSILKNFFE